MERGWWESTSLPKPSWTLKSWEKTPQAKLEHRYFWGKNKQTFFLKTPLQKNKTQRETTGDSRETTGDSQRETVGQQLKPTGDNDFSGGVFLRKDFWVFFKKSRCSSFSWGVFSQVFSVQLGLEREVSPDRLPTVSRLSPDCLPLSPVGLACSDQKATGDNNFSGGVF